MFLRKFGKDPERLSHVISVAAPMGDSFGAAFIYKGCILSIRGHKATIDLMVLEMVDLDKILVSCHATLYYRFKIVKFEMLGNIPFELHGDKLEAPHNLISILRA